MVPPRQHRKHLNLNKAFHVSYSTNRPNIAHSLIIQDLCFDISPNKARATLQVKYCKKIYQREEEKIKRGREGKISLNCSLQLWFGLSQCFGAVKSSTSYPFFSPQSCYQCKRHYLSYGSSLAEFINFIYEHRKFIGSSLHIKIKISLNFSTKKFC